MNVAFIELFLIFQVQGKDPSVEFTQDIVEESEDERGFEEIMSNDPAPPIELPPAEIARLEEIAELVSSCLPSPLRREKLAVAIGEHRNIIKYKEVTLAGETGLLCARKYCSSSSGKVKEVDNPKKGI